MNYTKVILLLSALVILSACGKRKVPHYKAAYYHQGIYFGTNVSPAYKYGVRDGCQTAKGFYKKNRPAFNYQPQRTKENKKYFNPNNTYKNGWFIGRNKCRHLLVLDKEDKKWN
jgi:hypothetical protein